jgi:hypothetical protein
MLFCTVFCFLEFIHDAIFVPQIEKNLIQLSTKYMQDNLPTGRFKDESRE